MTDKHNLDAPPPGGSASSGETNIVLMVEHRPEIVLLDEKKAELLFAHIEAEVDGFQHDMTTAKGRDATRALAAKVVKTKTTVDKSRLALTDEWRAKTKIVNESGAAIKARLEALAEKARAPLTAWEEAEEARLNTCKATLDMLRNAAVVPMGTTSEHLRIRIAEAEAVSLDESLWGGMLEQAQTERDVALKALNAALERVVQEEKDKAELARLRAAAEAQIAVEAERARQEENAQREREAAEREAAEAEQRRQREEQEREAEAERQRLAAERAASEVEERAREEERQAAEAREAEQARAHEAELAAERERTAEAARLAAEAEAREQQRLANEQAAEAERARLAADRDRRTAVMREAKLAIMGCDVSEDSAKKVVLAIMAGQIPRVVLDFSIKLPGEEVQS